MQIDKSDKLYNYLLKLGVEDIDITYKELADNGRYTQKDVQAYFYSDFEPSITQEIDETELEKVVDYYSDLKKFKSIKENELNAIIKKYKENPNKEYKDKILNAKLKDLLHLAINYKSSHKDVDLQDLVQVASVGLLKALDKFNINHKIPFKDYIIFWVREEVYKEFKLCKI